MVGVFRRLFPAATTKSALIAGAVVLAVSLFARWASYGTPAHVDEPAHLRQIAKFIQGDYRLYVPEGRVYPFLAMTPGYHLVIAAFAHALGSRSLDGLREIQIALSLLILPAGYAVAIHFDTLRPGLRAAQLFCFPFVFALSFVVSSDVFALTLSLASLAACFGGRFAAGGLLGLAGLLVRQANVVFLVFTPLYAYLRLPTADRPSAWELLGRCWAFLLAVLFLAAFVVANDGRLPLCSPKFQSVGLHGINLAFSAAIGAVAFLPWLVVSLPRVWSRLRQSRWSAAGTGLLLVTACLLMPVDDERNRVDFMPELLHNHVLQMATSSIAGRLVMAAATGWLFATMLTAGFERYSLAFLALIWLGTLLPLELVEPRYYLTTYALLILMRPPIKAYQEWVILGYFVACGLALHLVHAQTRYFL